MNIVNEIAVIPLFQGLPDLQLNALAKIVVVREYASGNPIFAEGDEGSGFYVVLDGRVKVYKLARDGKEQILHIFAEREAFGQVAVFTHDPFPAHAQAISKSRLLFVPREEFVALISEDVSLALNMLAALSRRLVRMADLIETLSLKEVPGRLATYFIELRAKKGQVDDLELDISKGQLASYLGTIPETVSRILAKMAAEGLIRLTGNRGVEIVDLDRLDALASGKERLS